MPNIVSAVRVGLATLQANPLRTSLSTLGVIIGVASLVAVLAVGDGLERFVRSQIERTTDLQTIGVRSRTSDEVDGIIVPRQDILMLTGTTRDSLAAALTTPADVFISTNGAARLSGGKITGNAAVLLYGIMGTAFPRRFELIAGEKLTPAHEASGERVAVVSSALARAYTGGAPEAAVGQVVRFGDADFRIVGVVADDDGDPRRAAVIPWMTLAAAAPAAAVRSASIEVRVRDAAQIGTGVKEVEAWMRSRYGPPGERYAIEAYSEMRLEQVRQGIMLFKLTMGTFAGIALVVGGIGIMNVLLSAVIERTREIGIRKACGARDRDVLAQFLSESVAISGAGAVMGAVLGLVGAFAATSLMRQMTKATIYAAFTWRSLFAAALVAVVIGLVFGTYPALRAARLSPVDAMRNE